MTAKKDILDALSNWNKALSTAKEETHKASLTTEENAREALSNWRKALSGGITKDEETIVQTLAKALQSEGEQSLIADIGLAWLRQLVDQFPSPDAMGPLLEAVLPRLVNSQRSVQEIAIVQAWVEGFPSEGGRELAADVRLEYEHLALLLDGFSAEVPNATRPLLEAWRTLHGR